MSTRLEKIPTTIYPSVLEGAQYVADYLADRIRQAQSSDRTLTVTIAAGKAKIDILACLQRLQEDGLSMESIHLVIPDERTPIPSDCDILVLSTGQQGLERMTVGALMKAREIIVIAWGERKAERIRAIVEDEFSTLSPAAALQIHTHTRVICDASAGSLLTRIDKPWLVSVCHWNDALTRHAIVWLCSATGKPILKLTTKDYNDHGLSDLITIYGSAYNCNIKVFNDLQHTITGWPGGKPNADDSQRPERALPFPKRILIFSPHPDDDVISMGGTFQRLINQGHEVHIAYQTSGCIAVNDDEVIRFMDFIRGFKKLHPMTDTVIDDKYEEYLRFLQVEKDGPLDSREILDLKALIRRGEATAACRHMGLPVDHIHFLNLPFYETGTIKKGNLTQRDIDIVKDLMTTFQPHQMFVAGDLADPHGTHRVCYDAIVEAIDQLKDSEPWLNDCRVWLYRGAWMEFPIDQIEMAVPMSPEELRRKRNTILKHQSQMESAPFLGNDERLFWQRAEDRNHATAEAYAQLGLANYEAIEAFVQYRFQKDTSMNTIISQFDLRNEVQEPQPLKVGFINDSFILKAKNAGEKSYFLQKINHKIFQDVEGLQRNIQLVTDHIRTKLREQGVPDVERRVLQLVPTKTGQLYHKTAEGEYWRVYVLIENASSQEKVTPDSAFLAGQAFGEFQCQLADIDTRQLIETIPNFHNIEFRLHQLDEALAEDKVCRAAKCKDIIKAINARREEMCLAERLHREGKLPKRINHCDTKVNNMMFDEFGKPLCIVDLDTVMPGYVLSDYGDFMRTAANTGDEDDRDLSRVGVNLEVFEAYTKGYLMKATFLTDLERSLLPFGCRLLSYMQAVRFFTDYINGDTYYKIQYPEHNLVRTKAQLRLLEEQERVAPKMEAIINAQQ